jgi:hypothetical protein
VCQKKSDENECGIGLAEWRAGGSIRYADQKTLSLESRGIRDGGGTLAV